MHILEGLQSQAERRHHHGVSGHWQPHRQPRAMAVDSSAPAPSQPAAPTEEWPPYADPSYKMPASIEVTVQKRNEDDVTLTVAILISIPTG